MFAFLPSIPGVDDVRALAGPGRYRPSSWRAQRLRARIGPAFDAARDDGLRSLAIISGGGRPMALRDVVAAIHRAAEDPRVAGLIARVQLTASPTAAVQELREAIALSAPSSRHWPGPRPTRARCPTTWLRLSVRSGCSPREMSALVGFASNAMFLRDALDKAGIEAQIVARGEYKSAANLFTESGFTDAHREAVTRMLESLRSQVWQAIAGSRKIDAGALDALADRAPLLRDDAVASGLVDRIGFRDEAYARIAELIGFRGCFTPGGRSTTNPEELCRGSTCRATRVRLGRGWPRRVP